MLLRQLDEAPGLPALQMATRALSDAEFVLWVQRNEIVIGTARSWPEASFTTTVEAVLSEALRRLTDRALGDSGR